MDFYFGTKVYSDLNNNGLYDVGSDNLITDYATDYPCAGYYIMWLTNETQYSLFQSGDIEIGDLPKYGLMNVGYLSYWEDPYNCWSGTWKNIHTTMTKNENDFNSSFYEKNLLKFQTSLVDDGVEKDLIDNLLDTLVVFIQFMDYERTVATAKEVKDVNNDTFKIIADIHYNSNDEGTSADRHDVCGDIPMDKLLKNTNENGVGFVANGESSGNDNWLSLGFPDAVVSTTMHGQLTLDNVFKRITKIDLSIVGGTAGLRLYKDSGDHRVSAGQ